MQSLWQAQWCCSAMSWWETVYCTACSEMGAAKGMHDSRIPSAQLRIPFVIYTHKDFDDFNNLLHKAQKLPGVICQERLAERLR